MDLTTIARTCHEANRVLQLQNLEAVSPAWDDLDREIRDSAIDGVQVALRGATPEELHQNWVEFKVGHGWRYGHVKDESSKTHPCIVPYADLPVAQQRKDALFHAIVNTLKN